MKVWETKDRGQVDSAFFEFQRSLPFDIYLIEEEIQVAGVWIDVLSRAGFLTKEEARTLKAHLKAMRTLWRKGEMVLSPEIEDVHTLVEQYLTVNAGEAGKKLHTGRSRNDLASATLRLYLMKRCRQIRQALVSLQKVVLQQAEQGVEILCPIYTHHQRAEVGRLSHYWLAHFFRLQRDRERLDEMVRRIAVNPIGAGAGSGTFVTVQPIYLEKKLGFRTSMDNALDGTSSRDFVAEFLSWACLLMTHLSSMAQEIVLWTSSEYQWAYLPDALTTGSSLLPHKRNPDGAELIRSKTGRVIGNFTALITTLKALPLGYSKDLQEDKERVLDTEKTVRDCLTMMTKMVRTIKFNPDQCYKSLHQPFLGTVAIIDELVRNGVPFRDAYREVADWARGLPHNEVPPDLSRFADRLPPDTMKKILDPITSVESRKVWCGVSRSATLRQIRRARCLIRLAQTTKK